MTEPRKTKIEQVKSTIIKETDNYDILAESGDLYTIPVHDNIDSIAEKSDMEALYAPELYSTCSHRIKKLFDKGGKVLAIERLKENIEDEQSHSNNSWKAAMYQAMIDSDWYWNIYLPSF